MQIKTGFILNATILRNLTIVCFFALYCTIGFAGEREQPPVRVSILWPAVKRQFAVGERFQISVLVKNESSRPIRLMNPHCCKHRQLLSFSIKGPDGRIALPTQHNAIFRSNVVPSVSAIGTDAHQLIPGAEFVIEKLILPMNYDLSLVGQYKMSLQINFNCSPSTPLTRRFISDTVSFEIIDAATLQNNDSLEEVQTSTEILSGECYFDLADNAFAESQDVVVKDTHQNVERGLLEIEKLPTDPKPLSFTLLNKGNRAVRLYGPVLARDDFCSVRMKYDFHTMGEDYVNTLPSLLPSHMTDYGRAISSMPNRDPIRLAPDDSLHFSSDISLFYDMSISRVYTFYVVIETVDTQSYVKIPDGRKEFWYIVLNADGSRPDAALRFEPTQSYKRRFGDSK